MDAKEETLHLFKQAVKRQMISDVPVGAYLSGESTVVRSCRWLPPCAKAFNFYLRF